MLTSIIAALEPSKRRRGGSVSGYKFKRRDREAAFAQIMRDYFVDNPLYSEEDFRRRYATLRRHAQCRPSRPPGRRIHGERGGRELGTHLVADGAAPLQSLSGGRTSSPTELRRCRACPRRPLEDEVLTVVDGANASRAPTSQFGCSLSSHVFCMV
jgi:hypothetical protein